MYCIVALVGGGSSPNWPVNNVIIWDCKMHNEISHIKWSTEIMSVKLLCNYLFVGVLGRIFVFDPQDFRYITSINKVYPLQIWASAPFESASGSRSINKHVIVTEGKPGYIKVAQFDISGETDFKTKEYKVHDGRVVCVAMSLDSKYCAMVSDKGTLIHIFPRDKEEKIRELRRGTFNAAITSITFSQTTHTWQPPLTT